MGGWLYFLGRRRALSSIPIADHHYLSPPTHNARPLTTPAMPATAHVFPPCCLSSQQGSSPHLFLSHHQPTRTQLPVCAIPPGTPALPPSLASPDFALPPRLRRSGYRPAQHRDFRHPRDEAGRVPEESTGLPAQQDARGRTEPASAYRRPGAHRPAACHTCRSGGRPRAVLLRRATCPGSSHRPRAHPRPGCRLARASSRTPARSQTCASTRRRQSRSLAPRRRSSAL